MAKKLKRGTSGLGIRVFTVEDVYKDILYNWPEADFEELLQKLAQTTTFGCFEPVIVRPLGV